MTRSPPATSATRRDSTTSTDAKNKNVGDLLNAKNVSWGWFQGGFRDCNATSTTTYGTPVTSKSYIPHHEPFQYFAEHGEPRAHRRPRPSPRSATTVRPTTSTT